MNETNLTAAGSPLANPGATWHVQGAGDFVGNGKADILWQNENGAASVWLMTAPISRQRARLWRMTPGPSWHVMSAEDVDGDGRADILWQNGDGAPALIDGRHSSASRRAAR